MQKTPGGQMVIPTSAIPIVNPSSTEEEAVVVKTILKPPLKGTLNSKRLCRNVIIHGFCKYEGKGCEFTHDSNKTNSPQTSPENKSKTRGTLFQPVSSVTADSINAPEFVPKFTTAIDSSTSPNKDPPTIRSHTYQSEQPSISVMTNGFSQFSISNDMNGGGLPMSPTSPSQMLAGLGMVSPTQLDPYYYMTQQQPMFPRQPLQHHLYSQPLPPNASKLQRHQKVVQNFFISEDIRQQLTQRNEAQLMTASARELGLPLEVHGYHSLYPLEPLSEKSTSFFDHSSTVYKAISSVDGRTYVLVRIEGFRLVNDLAMQVVEAWKRIRHCNIVTIRESFSTRSFGDSSLVFVYDYHPCSNSLYSTYYTSQGQASLGNMRKIPEGTIWGYITQIASALKAIHGSGLASRGINSKKILITGKNRIRLGGCAILDVLHYDGVLNVGRQQQEDLVLFGKLIIDLACYGCTSTNLQDSLAHISATYSAELNNFIFYLLSKPAATKSIDEIVVMIAPRILYEINCNQFYNDELESELSRELENGQLVRLISQMGFINERPEFDMDPGWSETGDRYLIKLFRDYVFHQVDEKGKPVIDISHVITCLNKLDAGVEEKIMLISRDEQSCLIVSFKEIRNCVISAYNDLTSGRK